MGTKLRAIAPLERSNRTTAFQMKDPQRGMKFMQKIQVAGTAVNPSRRQLKSSRLLVAFIALAAVAVEPFLRAQTKDPPPQQQDQQTPPPVIGGSGGSGGSGGGGAGGIYDGYTDIDWDGPGGAGGGRGGGGGGNDEIPISPLAFEPVAADGLIKLFRRATQGLAASVPSQPRKYEDAIESIEIAIEKRGPNAAAVAELEKTAATPDGLTTLGHVAAAAALARHLNYALAATYAQHRASPKDATVLYNMASLLVQRKMPNEAIALLDRLATTGQQPETPFGYQPDASIDYLRGYALLMIGELQKSAVLLEGAFARDKTLTDASYALAVAQEALGQDPRKALLQGMLRAYHGPLMYCGDKYDEDPVETEEDQNIAPPADKIFDLSKGTDGVLPTLKHPGSGPELLAMVQELADDKGKALQDEVVKHSQKADDLYTALSARLRNDAPDPKDLTDQALVDMLDEANACLKPLQKMFEQKNRALDELGDNIQATTNAMVADYQARLTATGEDANTIMRGMITKALSSRRGPINQWETAVRVHFKSWHKYATGLAGHLTDPEWREYADEKIKAVEAGEWNALYVGVIANYTVGVGPSPELYAPDNVTAGPTQVPPQPLWRCDESHRKASVEIKAISVKGDEWPRAPKGAIPDLGVTFKANCDKIAVEVDGKYGIDGGIVKAGVGGFVEGSINRAGDITLYGGPKFGVEAGIGAQSAASGSLKGGVYFAFDQEWGLKEVGTKIDSSNSGVSGSAKASIKVFEKNFAIWTAPPRPPKFDPESGLKIWKNINDLK
jgi:tetratricopeptide (TPR) repeat protein